jgi:hypothetical protein
MESALRQVLLLRRSTIAVMQQIGSGQKWQCQRGEDCKCSKSHGGAPCNAPSRLGRLHEISAKLSSLFCGEQTA